MKPAVIVLAVLGAIGAFGWLLQPTSLEESVTTQNTATIASDNGVLDQQDSSLAVPDFTVKTVAGETVTLSELVEDKPTLVGFWASWCHNCQRNLPEQDRLYTAYKDQVNVVEVNLNERQSAVDRYAQDTNYGFHMAYDESGVVSGAWNVQYTNTHFLIGGDGQLLEAFPGDVTEDHFRQLAASAVESADSGSTAEL